MADKKTEIKTDQKPNKQSASVALEVKKLNDAGHLLLAQLPDHVGQLVESLAKQYTIPIWQYVAGILLAVHLEGRLSEFRLDPGWKDGLKTEKLICKYCKKPFVPKHIGQPYCTNECGLAATGPKEHIENVSNLPEPDISPNTTSASKSAGWSDPVPTTKAA